MHGGKLVSCRIRMKRWETHRADKVQPIKHYSWLLQSLCMVYVFHKNTRSTSQIYIYAKICSQVHMNCFTNAHNLFQKYHFEDICNKLTDDTNHRMCIYEPPLICESLCREMPVVSTETLVTWSTNVVVG